jgi:hypothetical protein
MTHMKDFDMYQKNKIAFVFTYKVKIMMIIQHVV